MVAEDLTEYKGNCHCGAFKFVVKLPPLKELEVSTCDCRLCSRNAYLWAPPVLKENFQVISQREGMLDQFRYGTTMHQFCRICGTSVICYKDNAGDGESPIFVNLRAVAAIDLASLDVIVRFCGGSEPSETSPHREPLSNLEGDHVSYHANCHCGKVSYTFQTQPLAKTKSCNCSICTRNGTLWIYPPLNAVTVHKQDSLIEYSFGKRRVVHAFCGTCAVPIWEKFLDPAKADSIGLNVRAINDLDFKALPSRVHNGAASMPQYEF